MENSRKQIVFDIDTKVSEKILGENYNAIYYRIMNFLKKENFKHVEGTVYESKDSLTNYDIAKTIMALKKKYPYLDKCIRDIRQADISEVHTLNHLFSYDGTPGKYQNLNQQSSTVNSSDNSSRGNFSFEGNSEKQETENEITHPIKQKVDIEQAKRIISAGIPCVMKANADKTLFAVFDKSNLTKVEQAINKTIKKSKGR